MLWNCRHFSVCSENVLPCETSGLFHWAWHPEQTSSASEGWLVGLIWKTWRYPWGGKFRNMFSNQSNFQNIHQFSNHIKKKNIIWNSYSTKGRERTHNWIIHVCFFYQHRPSQCTTRIASLLQRCGLVPPAASWTGPLLGHTIGPSLAYDHLVNIQKAIENCHL